MIEYFVKSKEGELKKIDKATKNCWINVVSPSEEEITFLIEKFCLKKDDIIDGLDINEIPRFDVVDDKVYVFLSIPTEKIPHENMSSFLVVYSKSHLITISKYQLEILDRIFELPKKIRIFSSSRNLLKILFFISKEFDTSVHRIVKEIRKSKKDLNNLDNSDIEKLINYEDTLNNYISAFNEIIQNYSRILKTNLIEFPDDDESKLKDLINDLNETFNLCKNTLRTITNMRDYYSTKLSTNLNKTVTLLTISTIFLTIPTLVSSIFGMNIPLPSQTSPNTLYVLGAIVLGIWAIMFFIIKKMKII